VVAFVGWEDSVRTARRKEMGWGVSLFPDLYLLFPHDDVSSATIFPLRIR
jgi:hypothetical protein